MCVCIVVPPPRPPSLVCAVCLCVFQVRAAPTVTSWSNQTPTALPNAPPLQVDTHTHTHGALMMALTTSVFVDRLLQSYYILVTWHLEL